MTMPHPTPRRRLGDAGEALAAQALQEAGVTIVARNWRSRLGEIDIVAQEPAPDFTQGGQVAPWLVVVEVRTRRGDAFGTARQSITPKKQRKLRELAREYVQQSGWAGPWRIDVVAVQMDARGRLQQVEHIRHAVADE
jgi:putative endonuclease